MNKYMRWLLLLAAILFAPLFAGGARGYEGERLNEFFEEVYQRNLERSPMAQSRRGIRTDQDKWDDVSEVRRVEDAALLRADLKRLHAFEFDALNTNDQTSYRLFAQFTETDLRWFDWRRNAYLLTQMGGLHTRAPSVLINDHPIRTRKDAEDYIARIGGVEAVTDQLVVELKRQEAAGVRPPRFVYSLVIEPARKLITGAPFDESGADSPLWADFKKKVGAASLENPDELKATAKAALIDAFRPGYERLIAHLVGQMENADDRAGVWKLPDGDAYYRFLLQNYTTLPLDPDELHALGLKEVARIHDEMRAIMRTTGFDGDLQAFFAYMQEDEKFYYPDSDEGRAIYLSDAKRLLSEIEGRMDEFLLTKPSAEVVVAPIEPWREQSAPKAHYRSPPQDGSRAGVFYINLYDMRAAPKYQLPVILYHETVPGHHVETIIAYELEGLPSFRKFASISAFSEGWGLYAEKLPKEMGLYQNPYDDFGRLSLSLMRAVRLVVDTGIHAKKWTREEAVAYMDENMPSSHYDNQREVDRYIVLPGQATSYYVGMLKILALREKAREALGDSFDIRAFHDAVLGAGPLPLPMLEEQIDAYIKNQRSEKK